MKAALFDWDGTILDTRDVLLAAWHTSTEAVLGRRWPVDDEGERAIFTRPGVELFPAVGGDRADELAAAWQDAYAANAHGALPFDGVVAAVDAFRASGARIGVATSKVRMRFTSDVERAGLADRIDASVCAEDVERHKPHPDPVLRVLELLGVEPEDAIFVGDTYADVAAAVAAGVHAVGCTWGMGTEDDLRAAGAAELVHHPSALITEAPIPGGRP